MKIIEEKPFAHEFECKGCGSKLVAEASDVRYGDFGSCLSDSSNYRYYVVCVVCEKLHFIDKVTPKVDKLAQKASKS